MELIDRNMYASVYTMWISMIIPLMSSRAV